LKGFDTSGKSPAYIHHRSNLSPRRETGRGLFASSFLKSGFLNRTAVRISRPFISPMTAPRRSKRPSAPPSEPSTNLMAYPEDGMTAYLISLALAGLVAIAVWEGLS
jgi:hypothetical protein